MNTPKQTFPGVLQSDTGCGKMLPVQNGWLICPACRQWKVLRLLPDTEVKHLPVYCKRCHKESIVNIPAKSQSQ